MGLPVRAAGVAWCRPGFVRHRPRGAVLIAAAQ
jgi:hypothetical protein